MFKKAISSFQQVLKRGKVTSITPLQIYFPALNLSKSYYILIPHQKKKNHPFYLKDSSGMPYFSFSTDIKTKEKEKPSYPENGSYNLETFEQLMRYFMDDSFYEQEKARSSNQKFNEMVQFFMNPIPIEYFTSGNKFQRRRFFEEERYFPTSGILKQFYRALKSGQQREFHFIGPKEIGKSHNLAIFSALLRGCDNYNVVYIHDVRDFINAPTRYLLESLKITLCSDLSEKLPELENHINSFTNFTSELYNILKSNGKKTVFLVDQYNSWDAVQNDDLQPQTTKELLNFPKEQRIQEPLNIQDRLMIQDLQGIKKFIEALKQEIQEAIKQESFSIPGIKLFFNQIQGLSDISFFISSMTDKNVVNNRTQWLNYVEIQEKMSEKQVKEFIRYIARESKEMEIEQRLQQNERVNREQEIDMRMQEIEQKLDKIIKITGIVPGQIRNLFEISAPNIDIQLSQYEQSARWKVYYDMNNKLQKEQNQEKWLQLYLDLSQVIDTKQTIRDISFLPYIDFRYIIVNHQNGTVQSQFPAVKLVLEQFASQTLRLKYLNDAYDQRNGSSFCLQFEQCVIHFLESAQSFQLKFKPFKIKKGKDGSKKGGLGETEILSFSLPQRIIRKHFEKPTEIPISFLKAPKKASNQGSEIIEMKDQRENLISLNLHVPFKDNQKGIDFILDIPERREVYIFQLKSDLDLLNGWKYFLTMPKDNDRVEFERECQKKKYTVRYVFGFILCDCRNEEGQLDKQKLLQNFGKQEKLDFDNLLLFDATEWDILNQYKKRSSDRFTSHQKKEEITKSNNNNDSNIRNDIMHSIVQFCIENYMNQ